MKSNKLLNLYSFFIPVILFFSSTIEAQKLSVGWELWYPYQYHNNKQQLVGLDFDIFNTIINKANLSVSYTELPWKRHLQYINTGDMDIAMGASYTKERAEYAYFTEPYRLERVNFYVKKGHSDDINLTSLTELISSNYMIGVEGGYYYGEQYQELIKDPKFQSHISEVIDLEENIDLVLKGHLDGLLVDPVTMKAFTDKYRLQQEFEKHPLVIYHDDIHIMISKKSQTKATLDKLNGAINALKEDGTIDEIIQRWTHLQSAK